jgi:hypothetical protein
MYDVILKKIQFQHTKVAELIKDAILSGNLDMFQVDLHY